MLDMILAHILPVHALQPSLCSLQLSMLGGATTMYTFLAMLILFPLVIFTLGLQTVGDRSKGICGV